MKKMYSFFKQVNGFEVIKQYARAHVLIYFFIVSIVMGFSKKALEIVRLAVNYRILCKLRKKTKEIINNFVENLDNGKEHINSQIIWVCWMQGIENAPEIVKQCYYSLKNELSHKKIIFINEANYREYVEFPRYIQEKIDYGIIKGAHMTDLLRLALLIKYGGTWIDATVYCSGGDIPNYIFESDLFMFQDLKPGRDGHCTRVSNWLMTSCSNNCILELTQTLLYDYWKKHNKLIDYYIFHDFFELAIETFPNEWDKVIPYSNSTPHILLLRLFDKYDADMWDAVTKQTCIHKLTYKFDESKKLKAGTYYKKIMSGK